MGTTLGSDIILRAAGQLEDRAHATWTKEDHVGYLNEAQNTICLLRPDAKTRVRSVPLVAGTRQTIAQPDIRVLDITRNTGTDGQVPGSAITFIERRELDLEVPNWHSVDGPDSLEIQHWAYDQRTPGVWWCYPKQKAAGTQMQVEVITSCLPTAVLVQGVFGAQTTTAIDVDDIYVVPIVQFMVWRAFSRDSEYTQPGGKAALAWASFAQMMGLKTISDKNFRPEKSNPPFNSPPPAGNQGAFGDR